MFNFYFPVLYVVFFADDIYRIKEDTFEYAHAAPTDKTIIQSFARTIIMGSIPLSKAVSDNVYDAAEDPHIISPRNTMRMGKTV